MEPNFSGYVTKANLKCADGRTIMPGAFAHQDGMKVPLVYNHNHEDLDKVLGHVILTKKEDGVWGDAYLNESPAAANADILVKHGDIDKFSVWAKNLDERGADVHDGDIQEVSLVLAGANPGANIANVLMHSGLDEDDNMMIVGFEIKHADIEEKPEEKPEETPEEKPEEKPAEEGEETVADVIGTLNPKQVTAVNSVIDGIVQEAVTQALTEEPALTHSDTDSSKKGPKMARNLFDREKQEGGTATKELKHDDMAAILKVAKGNAADGGTGVPSLRELVRSPRGKELMHADTYGVQDIEILFPDAKELMTRPVFVDRRQDWVKAFMNGTSHSPFSRVKTFHADITADEARARGYIKGNEKVDEVFPIFKRSTGPAWIYKKQRLDRQDIIDITSFDVVAWLKVEMRGKMDEEIARAGLFGDGRPVMVGAELNPDKIQEPAADATSGDGIRSIYNDNDLYVTRYSVPLAADAVGSAWNVLLDTRVESQEDYLGSGNLTAFMTYRTAAKLLTIRDDFQHRIYRNLSEVASDMDVNQIVRVPTSLFPTDCLAIVLDLSDYNFGTDRGGELTLFDDFDIDFNQYKYLMEVYLSGALTLPYSAQIFMRVDPSDELIVPTMLSFTTPDTVEYVAQTGVVYKRTDTGATLAADIVLAEGESVTVEATPAAGYYFESDDDREDSRTYEYGDPTG